MNFPFCKRLGSSLYGEVILSRPYSSDELVNRIGREAPSG